MSKDSNDRQDRYKKQSPVRELQPHETMMTIRWYVNELEQQAMGVAMNNPRGFERATSLLHDTLNGFAKLMDCGDEFCPCPYPICPNGDCAPECGGPRWAELKPTEEQFKKPEKPEDSGSGGGEVVDPTK